MINNIDAKLNLLRNSIEWVKDNLTGDRKETSYDVIVKQRLKLKIIKEALNDNPAAVLYGISQQGKSYLASSLLSESESRFSIVDPGSNRAYDFVNEINPRGEGKESTGVVTRFTVCNVYKNKDFPVKVKLLTVADIILILCDTYYNDIASYVRQYKADEISEKIETIENSLNGRSNQQSILTEDDILLMKSYFECHTKSKASYILDSDFFKKVSRFIELTTINEWLIIFPILWNDNKHFTELFERLMRQYQMVGFAKEVYVKIEAILREKGEILDVVTLKTLMSDDDCKKLDGILIKNETEQKISVEARFLSAMSAEVVLQLPEKLSESKAFLETTDIIDFPGARSRYEDKTEEVLLEDRYRNLMVDMYLRGKVAYLFNKYSESYRINTLLYCHGNKQAEVRFVPLLLEDWVKQTIGKTKDERTEFMKTAVIPPLFVIGTFFNNDLKKNQNDDVNDPANLASRWKKRFDILKEDIFGTTNSWFDQWTVGSRFNNFYFLRDFYYSSPEQDNIFEGWTKNGGKEIKEISPKDCPDFKERLRKSFIDYSFVKDHFPEPEKSWDESATLNKDGSEYIISRLTEAAQNINESRMLTFNNIISKANEVVGKELHKYYHDESSDGNLAAAKRMANEVQGALDIAFGRDSYFFGKLMQNMVLNEGDVYKLFHQEFQKGNMQEKKDLGQYVYIRMRAVGLSQDNDFDTNLAILSKAYEMTPDDCKSFFERKGVNLDELFKDSDNGLKNISQSLAELLEDFWFYKWLKGVKYDEIVNLIDQDAFDNILSMLHLLYNKLDMTRKMSYTIRRYVDKFGTNVDEIQEMISDMCAEMLNKFVSSVGYSYLSDDAIQSLKDANEKQNLGMNFSLNTIPQNVVTPESIANLFDVMDDLDTLKNNLDCESLGAIPGVISRKRWSELLKIGFIQTQDIPNYDCVANKKLGEILKGFGFSI